MTSAHTSHDTIAAIATPPGIGGIAVIRISGERAVTAADMLFRGASALSAAASHTVHYGTIVDPVSRGTIDTVLATVFRNPASFTGEDVVEISSHGGHFVAQRILSVIHACGVRPADPGEFTLRAFLNGKMDLAQAEAVADIIHARSERAHKASVDQLSGKLSRSVTELRQAVLDICSLLELELDFSQEGIELAEKNRVIQKLSDIEQRIHRLSSTYREGKVVKEGVRVALVGRPNAGKSSLLNILLKEERAIVSDIPGTTRDTIEESILLEGVEFIFKDTAGLRESMDAIEMEGMKRTSKAVEASDVVIHLVDGSQPVSDELLTMERDLRGNIGEGKVLLTIVNKADIRHEEVERKLPKNLLWISCLTLEGIDQLKQKLIAEAIPRHDPASSSVTITSLRHRDALERALASVANAREAVSSGLGGDFAAVDLRAALNYLGEIIGLTTPDDILNNIFANFCIGK